MKPHCPVPAAPTTDPPAVTKADPTPDTPVTPQAGPVRVRLTGNTGLYIQGTVHQVPLEWLVDTGCSTTLLSSRKYAEIPQLQQPVLRPYNSELLSADNTPISVRGLTTLTMRIGDQDIVHPRQTSSIAARPPPYRSPPDGPRGTYSRTPWNDPHLGSPTPPVPMAPHEARRTIRHSRV